MVSLGFSLMPFLISCISGCLRKRLEETGREIVLYDVLINPVDGEPVEE